MLRDFIVAGYSEELFWASTLRQVDVHLAAARRRLRIERNMMMEVAYYAAIVPHQRTPLKLDKLLVRIDDGQASPRKQPWDQQLAAMQQIMKRKRT